MLYRSPSIEMSIRVSHLQKFWISYLFQAGMSACHTQEQEKYRSYMFYVYIFQLFLTFVSYENCLVVKKWENVSNWPKQSKKYVRSDVVTQKIQCKSVFTVHLLILKMFQTDFGCTMNICPNFFCHSGQCQQHKSPMTQLFGIFFGQTLLFSLSTFFLGLPNNANASKKWKFATELVIIGEHIIFFSLKQPFGHNKRLHWKNKWTIMTLEAEEPEENYWQCHKINQM